jgi:moderate conductance mechanosensitive channel
MPNWPVLTLALSLALVAAYLVADVIARAVQSILRAIIDDRHLEELFVDRPRRVIRLVIFLVTAAALVVPALRYAGITATVRDTPDAFAQWALNSGLRIAVIAIAAYLVIRIGSAAASRFEREMSSGTGLDVVERTKRAKTLGLLLQKTLFVVVCAMAGLMILREIGVDITPVLTGAGIVGLAVGFGAQTLVRDVISGFFLILEDQVRVGDVANINGQGGLVEAVNLRTIVLRDEQGAVHVFPNGEVKTLANQTKDFAFYVVSVNVDFADDPDAVTAAMNEAAATMMNDPGYQPHILAPLEIYGVDDFQKGQIVVKARIKTVPLKQWSVGRELRRRIVKTFAERGLQLSAPPVQLNVEGSEKPAGPP